MKYIQLLAILATLGLLTSCGDAEVVDVEPTDNTEVVEVEED